MTSIVSTFWEMQEQTLEKEFFTGERLQEVFLDCEEGVLLIKKLVTKTKYNDNEILLCLQGDVNVPKGMMLLKAENVLDYLKDSLEKYFAGSLPYWIRPPEVDPK